MLYFDLFSAGDIPATAVVHSAVLYLTSTDGARTFGDFYAYGILTSVDWRSGTFNWNTAVNGLQICYELDCSMTATSVVVPGSSTRKMWDITTLAQLWVGDKDQNNGLLLAASGERDIICSRTHFSTTSRPKLEITWSA